MNFLENPTGDLFGTKASKGLFDTTTDAEAKADTRTAEKAARDDVNAAFADIHAARKQQQQRMKDAGDTEFWFAMHFQNRAQKEQFLELLKLLPLGDKYIDGWEAAKVLGVKLDRVTQPYNKVGAIDKKFADLAL